MSSTTFKWASVMLRHLSVLVLALLSLEQASAQAGNAPPAANPPPANEQAKDGPEAIKTEIAINDEDPESSVPTPEQAMKNPLQMGYLIMAFSDRAEAALQAKNPAKAAKYFQAMSKAVPERAVSYRKACEAHLAAGNLQKAVDNCRAALGKSGVTGADHLAYVRVMLKRPGTFGNAEVGDLDAVIERLSSELGMGADEKGRRALAEIKCQVAVRLAQPDRLATCTQELERLKFEKSTVLPYAWALAIAQQNVPEAESVLQEAKQAGLPAAATATMETGIARLKEAQKVKLGDQIKRWWPGALAVVLALAALAAVRVRKRSRLNPA